jgi:hypothetical protein
MTALLPILLVAVAIGFYEGRKKFRPLLVVLSGLLILATSNLVVNWQWFAGDPSTWTRTYVYGLFQTGVFSFAFHVVPFLVAYFIGRRVHTRTGGVREANRG